MEGAPHVHIDNREDSPAMVPGYGCHDGFGGGGLMGMILGAALFGGGFGGLGRNWGGACGGAGQGFLGSEIMMVDRDVLKAQNASQIGDCEIKTEVLKVENCLSKEIGANATAIALMGKDNEISNLKQSIAIDKEFDKVNCKLGKIECQISQIPGIIANVNAKTSLLEQIGAIDTLTPVQAAALTASVNSIGGTCFAPACC